MTVLSVVRSDDGWRLDGSWPDLEAVNRFLAHLGVRGFAAATVRAYALDALNFAGSASNAGSNWRM